MGKIRAPYYRVVVMDSRKKRDGRAIEEIGKYHPTEEPSLIGIDGQRPKYSLAGGAQPSEPVLALLTGTGGWPPFNGIDGADGSRKTKEAKECSVDLRQTASG